MWLKFGVAKLLCIYIGLTKFEENPEGSSFFCVDLTWNDPHANSHRQPTVHRAHPSSEYFLSPKSVQKKSPGQNLVYHTLHHLAKSLEVTACVNFSLVSP